MKTILSLYLGRNSSRQHHSEKISTQSKSAELKNKLLKVILSSLLMSLSINSFAEDEILSLEGARIRGNQELPNVLYLIPWKPPKVYKLEEPESNLAANRPFKMLDRGSFKRLVNYHEAFKRQKTHQ